MILSLQVSKYLRVSFNHSIILTLAIFYPILLQGMASEIAQDVYHHLCSISTTVSESVPNMAGYWIPVVRSV